MIHLYIVILRGLVWLADVAMTAATRWGLFTIGTYDPVYTVIGETYLKGRVINIDWLMPIIGLQKYKHEYLGEAIEHALDQLREDET